MYYIENIEIIFIYNFITVQTFCKYNVCKYILSIVRNYRLLIHIIYIDNFLYLSIVLLNNLFENEYFK